MSDVAITLLQQFDQSQRREPMPDVISFEEAIARTKGKDRALLVGNGFSAQYFSYASLLAESGLEDAGPLRSLFERLQTADFETVVRALEGAAIVEEAYGNDAHGEEIRVHAQAVREALVRAVNKTHPVHRNELIFQYESSAKFIEHFVTVFSLNYDLLLYWVNLEKRLLRDGFGLGDRHGRFYGPFSESADCHLFNLHGGLHLFDDGEGGVLKAVDTGGGVIATITDTIVSKRRLPIYVAEGTSAQKTKKINSVSYLRYCYDALRNTASSLFVYGHSADDNDAHIYRAIFESEASQVFFGVYKPDAQKLRVLDGRLANYQRRAGSEKRYTFYDSESAKVWE